MDKYKRDILFRRVGGKKMLPTYLAKIAYLFPLDGRPNLISLEETDVMLEQFRVATTKLHRCDKTIPANMLNLEFNDVKNHPSGFYVLIDEDWKFCGTFVARDLRNINTNVKFGETISNDIIFISLDMTAGVSFDFFEVAGNNLVDIKKWQVAAVTNLSA